MVPFHKQLCWVLALCLAPCLIAMDAFGAPDAARAKNVILVIVDGGGFAHHTLARWVKGAPLHLDSILVGAVKSHSVDSVINGSGASATAMATGRLTNLGTLAMTPRKRFLKHLPRPKPEAKMRPLATVLEGARLLGKSTGVVCNDNITGATPGAFYSHTFRWRREIIAEQAVYQGMDVVLGGGWGQLLPKGKGGKRRDGRDLTKVLRARGYQVAKKAVEIRRISGGKVFGLLARDSLDRELKRKRTKPQKPTLAELVHKAISLLSQNQKGFFLVVESSQVDWASHGNEPASMVQEYLMFDQAVKVALDFARKDMKTLLLVLPDHSTGGLSIGGPLTDAHYIDGEYQPNTRERLVAPLLKMRTSASVIAKEAGREPLPEQLQEAIEKHWGLEISLEHSEEILRVAEEMKKKVRPSKAKNAFHRAIAWVVSHHYTILGWTTGRHTGEDLPLWAFGPGRPQGLIDTTQVGKIIAWSFGLDLDALNQRLFVEAEREFGKENVSLYKDAVGRLKLFVSWKGKKVFLPVNQNLIIIAGKTMQLEGLVVHSEKARRTYLPRQAVNLIKDEEHHIKLQVR